MNPQPETESSTFSEFTVPNGCVLCDGTMVVRITHKGAVSLCRGCFTLAKPKLDMTNGRITLEQKFGADA